MSNGEALREAIRANPADATARLVFADWLDENDQPGGDLIRLLVTSSPWEVMPQVVAWFHTHHGWPLPERVIASQWMWEVLDAKWWPDRDRLRECVQAIARRVLPLIECPSPLDRIDDYARLVTQAANAQGVAEMSHGWPVARAAALLVEFCLSTPADGAGDAANEEYREQVHVVAWAWLGLPPLRKGRSLEVSEAIHELPSLPTPESELPRRPWWRRLFGG